MKVMLKQFFCVRVVTVYDSGSREICGQPLYGLGLARSHHVMSSRLGLARSNLTCSYL